MRAKEKIVGAFLQNNKCHVLAPEAFGINLAHCDKFWD
jgi:hypothetical protein